MDYGCGEAAGKLRAARHQIVHIAARWQAVGIDTSPLTEPLLVIQDAIADLERRAEADKFRSLSRDLRNHFNAVRVSGAGLETEDNRTNRLRWLDMIEQAADRCIETLDKMEQACALDGGGHDFRATPGRCQQCGASTPALLR
jgi:hypothetical protein